MNTESLEVLARMTDTKVELRDMVDNWLLITYDIPCTEAGNRARAEFLSKAAAIGATRHTDSVYLLPWTPVAERLALELARSGEVIVWTSKITDAGMSQKITRDYDKLLEPLLDKLKDRIDKIMEHLHHGRMKRVANMMEKTEKQVAQLEQAVNRRGAQELVIYFQIIKRRFENISSGGYTGRSNNG